MEKQLKILLPFVLVGILLLLLLSSQESNKITLISEIDNKYLNKQININANISSIKSYNNQTFHVLYLYDSTGNITGIINEENLIINKSKNYIITGKIQEYNKTLQLSIEKMMFS